MHNNFRCCHGLIVYCVEADNLGIEIINEGDDLHLGGLHVPFGLLLAMHPVVKVKVAFGPDEHPVDGKATPDAEGDVAVCVLLCEVNAAILGVVLKVGAKGAFCCCHDLVLLAD